ncbi:MULTISPECIES: hypothetical protein [Kitasatospora]|uniref:Uncharacterized protein n=2 Tax=Kitasatospora TaxID=2063 RepID=A0ABT1IVT3_9ACTN|nr:hypothetical protein [Kitasatospora paracochleata]MCP2309248.1 hypothetical protein [Kitasatospora paracochleata]
MADRTDSLSQDNIPHPNPLATAPSSPVVALLGALGDFAALDEESSAVALVTVQTNDTLAIPGMVELGSAATGILAALVAAATALAELTAGAR